MKEYELKITERECMKLIYSLQVLRSNFVEYREDSDLISFGKKLNNVLHEIMEKE